ncbi:MAG: XisI protein [Anaerolineae bacterium]|jgi:hypothetical protein|nr:XisI protein [Anaerolineae bacterium]
MDTYESERQLVERILGEYASIPYSNEPSLETQTVFDRVNDHYILMNVGWEERDGIKYRLHYPLVHIDIINGKFWIQHDGTDFGIARELVNAGIPKSRIVLAFRAPELRQYTEYAVE